MPICDDVQSPIVTLKSLQLGQTTVTGAQRSSGWSMVTAVKVTLDMVVVGVLPSGMVVKSPKFWAVKEASISRQSVGDAAGNIPAGSVAMA